MKNKLRAMGLVGILFVSSLTAFSAAVAADQSGELMNKALEGAVAGAKGSFIREVVKNSINGFEVYILGQATTGAAGQVAKESASSTGSTVVAVVDLGLATKDFAEAKTDKQRLYSGARVAASVVTMVAPPVGAIVNLCVTAVQLTEALLSIDHVNLMQELERKTLEDWNAVWDIQKSFAEAERIQIHTLTVMIGQSYRQLAENQLILKKCASEKPSSSDDVLSVCIPALVRNLYLQDTLIQLNQRYLLTPTQYFDKEKNMESSGIAVADYIKNIEKIEAQFQIEKEAFAGLIAKQAQALYDLNIKKIEKSALPDFKEVYIEKCLSRTLELARAGATLLYFDYEVPAELKPNLSVLNYSMFKQNVGFLKAQQCQKNADKKNPLYPTLIKNLKNLDQLVLQGAMP